MLQGLPQKDTASPCYCVTGALVLSLSTFKVHSQLLGLFLYWPQPVGSVPWAPSVGLAPLTRCLASPGTCWVLKVPAWEVPMATRWWLCVCSLGILLLVPCALSEIFSLADSSHPVVGVFGRDVVLPCQLSPPARVPNMDVLWKKIDTGLTSVHDYLDEGHKDQPGQGYQTRTELFLQEFSRGNVSLKLKQLRVADAGKYQCLVRNPDWTQEAITELQVAAVAPVFIDVLGPRDQGIGLACRSSGWFPKPELQWVGKNQQKLEMEIKTNVTQERESLYGVVSHVTVTERENSGDIICIVRHGLMETQQQSAICLSGDVFPRESPWLAAFWVLFTLVLIAAGACAYREYRVKRKKKPAKKEALLLLESGKKTLEAEFQELLQVQEAERKAFDSERQELQEKFETLDKEKKDLDLEYQKLREILGKFIHLPSRASKPKLPAPGC
nr:butyrophilin-like protein 1 isoform X1 [Pelodiscus sinensis]|eukprot:XP_025038624.1 butyrophilin-like protein 1 isoform X1 [Pelodiscus sinensis]